MVKINHTVIFSRLGNTESLSSDIGSIANNQSVADMITACVYPMPRIAGLLMHRPVSLFVMKIHPLFGYPHWKIAKKRYATLKIVDIAMPEYTSCRCHGMMMMR